jgi:hypothetical protein
MAKNKNGRNGQDADAESLTFSLRAHPGDTIARRYRLAQLLGVAVSSTFRRDLSLYDILLSREEETLTTRERKNFVEIVRTLALNAAIRSESVPDSGYLVRYLRLAGKDALCPLITNATALRLFLIVDRAREHAGRIEQAAQAQAEGRQGHGLADLKDASTANTTDMEAGDVAE